MEIRVPNIAEKLSSFLQSTKRVLVISNKPDTNQFLMMAKATGIGIAVIALIGFFLQLVFSFWGIGF